MYSIIISFFALITVSLVASLIDRKIAKYNFAIFTLKYVPMVCAVMGMVFIFTLPLLSFISRTFQKQTTVWIFFAQILVIMAAGFLVFLLCARKKNLSFLKVCLSFLLGFAFSLALTIGIFALNCLVYFDTFQNLKIHNSCHMRLKPLFTMCPEYDRQIVFNSGKTIGIHLDTCGLSDFHVYRLNNGYLYLECLNDIGYSYVIDEENEKVYERIGDNISELKTEDPINGMSWDCNAATYLTYGKSGNKTYKSDMEKRERLFEDKEFLGTFSRRGFFGK